MNNKQRLNKLCAAIMNEAVQHGCADIWDESWNPDYCVQMDLTINEIRLAARLINFKPTKKQLNDSEKSEKWNNYLDDLDGVE